MKCVSSVGNEHTAMAFIRCAQKLHPEKKAQRAFLDEGKVILETSVILLDGFVFCFFF